MKKFLIVCAMVICLMLFAGCAKRGAVSKTPTGTAATVSLTPGTVVVAESDNAISDQQKQAVLDELSKELDDAFGAGKNLTDLEDSDLNTDNIP